MNNKKISKASITALVLALAPMANASSASDIENIRNVLQGLGYPESALSNEQIVKLGEQGENSRSFSKSIEEYKKNAVSEEKTCGTGTHGGSN